MYAYIGLLSRFSDSRPASCSTLAHAALLRTMEALVGSAGMGSMIPPNSMGLVNVKPNLPGLASAGLATPPVRTSLGMNSPAVGAKQVPVAQVPAPDPVIPVVPIPAPNGAEEPPSDAGKPQGTALSRAGSAGDMSSMGDSPPDDSQGGKDDAGGLNPKPKAKPKKEKAAAQETRWSSRSRT